MRKKTKTWETTQKLIHCKDYYNTQTASLIKKKVIRNDNGDNFAAVANKKIRGEYYNQFYANLIKNLDKMDRFLENI